jgi:nitrite reductase (NADH) small subunit
MTATLDLAALSADTLEPAAGRHRVCAVAELELAWGEAALIAGRQVA